MAKYMKFSYPNIAYNKDNERKPIQELDLRNHEDSDEEIVNTNYEEQKDHPQGCSCEPKRISGEHIDLSIDLLLDNSENLGEHRFDVPNTPESLIQDQDFREKYYESFYHKLLKIFEGF